MTSRHYASNTLTCALASCQATEQSDQPPSHACRRMTWKPANICYLADVLQVPDDYDATYKHFAAQGARVIALARRVLPQELTAPELRSLAREEVEKDMEFEGFAVFQVCMCRHLLLSTPYLPTCIVFSPASVLCWTGCVFGLASLV